MDSTRTVSRILFVTDIVSIKSSEIQYPNFWKNNTNKTQIGNDPRVTFMKSQCTHFKNIIKSITPIDPIPVVWYMNRSRDTLHPNVTKFIAFKRISGSSST